MSRPRSIDSGFGPLWIGVAAVTLVRALAAFPENMWGWGLNHGRFLGIPGWVLWGLGALLLIPPVARPTARALRSFGDLAAERPLVPALALGLSALLLVALVPDQLFHVGDFLMRLGSIMAGLPAERVFPQALPLDLKLHVDLVHALMSGLKVDAYTAERITGAAGAFGLGLLALRFARALGLRGVPAATAALVVVFAGTLGLFAGYGKGLREMVLVTTAAGAFGVDLVRRGRGAIGLGLTLVVGLLLHRSALFLLPGLLAAWWLAGFTRPESQALGTWTRRLAVGLPLVALAAMSPRLYRIISTSDAIHLSPVGGGLSPLAAFVAPVHLVDILNIVALLAPAALLIPFVLGRTAAAVPSPAEARADRDTDRFLLALLLPLLALLLVAHPRQGMFRDWDVFAASAQALSLVAAWWIGRHLRDRGVERDGAGAAVVGLVLSIGLQWFLLLHEFEPGTARVAAYAREAPRRAAEERMMSWEYLGVRNRSLGRLDEAAGAYAEAARVAPIARIEYMLGLIEAERGHIPEARDAYRRVTAASPTLPDGWHGLAVMALQLGDRDEAAAAARRLLSLVPGHPQARKILAGLAADSARAAASGATGAPMDTTASR